MKTPHKHELKKIEAILLSLLQLKTLSQEFNIKRVRHALGMTQEQLARAMGVTLRTIARWEDEKKDSGQFTIGTLEKLLALIDSLT